MEEIKVGEYVRTKKGNIFKIIGGNSDNYDIDINYYKLETTEDDWYEQNRYNDNGYWFTEEHILKHSPNIIDLIEVGDYVNGKRVDTAYENGNLPDGTESIIFEDDIKSIVTKEMFKSIEYEV